MKYLVTGAAGFVGSRTTSYLLGRGERVVGLDALTSYYDVAQKRSALEPLLASESFEFLEADLNSADLDHLLGADTKVIHLAGQPGVRPSWSHGFDEYVTQNIGATQRLLERAKEVGVGRMVVASSSSVYGFAPQVPTPETAVPAPFSPYGVTKLAAEHLTSLYARNFGLPTVSLRFLTVYGPGQRPDMALHRIIEGVLGGGRFSMYGDGSQRRDFTFVDDAVDAIVAAADGEPEPGAVFNVASGSPCTLRELIDAVSRALGSPVSIDELPSQPGDVDVTSGDVSAIGAALGWMARRTIDEGVAAQVAWHEQRRERS